MYVGVAKMKCRENRHVELETSLRCWIEGVVVDLVICFRPLENKRVKQNLAKFCWGVAISCAAVCGKVPGN